MFSILLERVGLSVDDLLDDLGLPDEEEAGLWLSVESWQTAEKDESWGERATRNSAILINTVQTILRRNGVDPDSPFKNNGADVPT